MKLSLFRHAEKQSDWTYDPVLSPYGEKQALKLSQNVQSNLLPRPDQLYVSPKKRAQATFAPLSKDLKIPLAVQLALDEKHKGEDSGSFRLRVQNYLKGFNKTTSETVYLCTHMDWLEEALSLIPCDTDLSQLSDFYWAPAAYLHFEIRNIWHLQSWGHIK